MSQGPSIQGQIVINTESVNKAITSVKKLQTNVQKSFGLGGQAAANFSKTLDRQTQSYNKVAQSNQKYQNIIAKAANQVANYEAAVRKSNATDAKKASLIKAATSELKGFEQAVNQVANYEAAVRKSNATDAKKASLTKAATSELKGFEQAVRGGVTSGQQLDNVNTQLSVSMGQLKRNLASASQAEADKVKSAKQLEQAQIRTDKAVSQATIQYQNATRAVRDSGMAEADKLPILARLDAEHKKLTQTLTNSTTSTRQAASAQNRFRESLSQVNAVARKSRMTQQAAATNKYTTEMRNLSTSVVVALGPLSGIASRLTALTTLFNRNAASVALLLASLTALSVAFSRSAKVAEEAEKQMFRINAQLSVLGDTAKITGDEINAMAHGIAASTLLSAKEVRDASGALLQFGGIGRSQFSEVIKLAQGMSNTFGGNLRGNIRKLGRAIDDPVDGLQRLETSGVNFTESVKDQIMALSAQGKQMEATNILLNSQIALQKAAEEESHGLAGAYDTVSGNLTKLMEDLFLNSGAAQAMADSVNSVAAAIKEFSESAQAEVLGKVFKSMAESAGTAFEFLAKNVKFFGGALAFIIGSTIPKAVLALAVLGKAGFDGVMAKAATAKKAILGFSFAQIKATHTTRTFTAALLSNPFTGIVVGITAITAAWWAYDSAISTVESNRESAQDAIINSVKRELKLRMDLTKSQADLYKEEGQALQDRQDEHAASLKAMRDEEKNLEKQAKQTLGGMATVMKTSKGGGMIQEISLSTERLEMLLRAGVTPAQEEYINKLIETRKNMGDVEEAAENITKETQKLLDTISSADAGNEITEAMEKLENQLKTINSLSAKFLPDISKMEELQKQLATAKELSAALAESIEEVPEKSEEARAAFERSQKIVKAIKEQIEEMADVEINREVVKFRDSLRDAAMEANKLSDLAGADEVVKPFIELNYEMEKLEQNVSETVAEMDAEAVAQFAKAMGMSGAGSDDVVKEFVARMKAEKERAIEAKKIAAAHETIDSFQKSQLTQTQALKDEYKDLYSAAITSGNTEDLPKISEWFKKEQAKIEEQASQTASTPFTNLDRIQEEFDARKELLASLYADDEEKFKEHLERMQAQQEKNKMFMEFAHGAEQAADVVGGAMEAMQTAGKENSSEYKAMAKMQAVIAGALAISKIWAENPNPAYAIPMTAIVSANVGAQVAAINSANYATGGYVSGPGTSTSDSIAANLSNGEFVMQAEAVKNIGRRNMEMMNAGRMPSFSSGGPVGVMPMPIGGSSGGSGELNVTIVDQSSGKKEYTTEETTDASGQRNLKVMVRDAVKDSINRGELDREMTNAYGIRRQARRV